METALTAAIATAPNLLIAIWVIWQQQKTLSALLENQQKLLDRLMPDDPPKTQETDGS